MRICKVYDDHYPWDIRVEKVGRTLVEAGHEVFLASRNPKRAQRHEHVDTMHVTRMPTIPLIPPEVDVGLMFPAFFSPRWLHLVAEVTAENRCDVILVRDLPLALTGLAVGAALGKPVVLDMAENYPAALRAIHAHKEPTLFDHLARNPQLAQWVEDTALPQLAQTLVVCPENRDRLLEKGVPPEKVSIVGNTPSLDLFTGDPPPPEVEERFDGAFVLLYVGAVDPFRGLDTMVEALPAIREEIPNVRLAVIGKGGGAEEVVRHAEEKGVRDALDMVGFRPLAELPGLIARGDVCVIPHHRNEHIDTTLPNKLFDYMALSRPVLSTDALPLKRIIEEEGSGMVYASGDPASAAEKVIAMRDDAVRREMGERGRKAVEERYNWGEDAKVLVRVFEELERAAS